MGIKLDRKYVCNVCTQEGPQSEVAVFTPDSVTPPSGTTDEAKIVENRLNNTVVIHNECLERMSATELLTYLEIEDTTYSMELAS